VTATLTRTEEELTGEGPCPHVSFVVPAYNEEERLPASLDTIIAFLGSQRFDTELIVVDDGSADTTPDIVRRWMLDAPPNVSMRLLQHERNLGKGAAIRTGCLAAEGDFIFYIDADLATPPEDAVHLLARLEDGADVAIGTRVWPDGSDMRASQPLQRRLAGRAFTTMRKLLRVLPDIQDTQCPMKGFRRDVARAVFERQRLEGWIFDAEVLHLARSMGYEIVAVPVHWRHVEGSRLRVRPQQAFEVLRDLIKLKFFYAR